MTRTITIFFDTSDSDNLGYSAQLDIPGRPGVADEPGAQSLGSAGAARRCASGPRPPARVQRAARVELGIGRTPILWARYDGAAEGWTGTLRD
jgi:hypothetical protein